MPKNNEITHKRTFEQFTDLPEFKTNPFGQNVSGTQAFKRTERIIIAVYLLTNAVPESEPARSSVRACAHELMGEVLTLRVGLRAAGDERIGAIGAQARELISLVWALHVAGYISRHNAEIVMQAIDDLGAFVQNARVSTLSEHMTFSKQDMSPAPTQAVARKQPVDKSPTEKTAGSAHSDNGHNVRYNNDTNRQSSILDILRNSGELGIKDISSQIIGCSEKTVQRELSALIEKGLVRKKGKKRWSTYGIS